MLATYTNRAALPLSIAVFLATDHYDYDTTPDVISTTALIKPLRQIVLPPRVPAGEGVPDVADLISARMGTAIHNGIENAWKFNAHVALKALGYPPGMVRKVKINPRREDLEDGDIPVYVEDKRMYRMLGDVKISGKPDFIGDGRLEDHKSTSVYAYMNGTSDEKHKLQGSIYRWIDAGELKRITADEMAIQYIFTDWQAMQARTNPKYPKQRSVQKLLPLMSLAQTESYLRQKIALVNTYMNAPEVQIPPCNDEDLWRKEPIFKYYKNPEKTKRATNRFDTAQEAQLKWIEDGRVGVVKEIPGEVTACKYCPAFFACTQKDALIASGDLVL